MSRFEKQILIPLPDEDTRKAILEIQLFKKGYQLDFELNELIDDTEGYSGREIERLCKQATSQMIGELMRFQQAFGNQVPLGDELFSGLRERAERKVRAGLLFSAVADQQKLEVTDADVDAKLAQIAEQTGKHVAKVRVEYTGERRDQLRMQILENKLLEYLLSQATITDAAPNASGAQAEAK